VPGVFDPANARPGAVKVRSRADLIGFVSEHPDYQEYDEIGRKLYLIGNPTHRERDERTELIRAFPVRAPEDRRSPLGERQGSDT
jgi:hypothetical protein